MTSRNRANWRVSLTLAAAGVIAATSFAVPLSTAHAQPASSSAARGDSVSAFYAARGWQPLWLARPGNQVQLLLQTLSSARIDGLDPRRYDVKRLQRAVRAARGGNPAAVRKADAMLSQALVKYAQDLARPRVARTIYVDRELRPDQLPARTVLGGAATAHSLEQYVARMGWMHPLYGELRNALASGRHNGLARQRLLLNLERARELPNMRGRHVLVNSAAQRLYMYEDGQVVDHMRVVVGKPSDPTPMMAAFIRYTSLNPYWNVPSDIAAKNLAPNVVKQGVGYLRQKGYQVIASGCDKPKIIDPRTIDWKAVAAGRKQVYMRQLPGPSNSMGRMKFMFPNRQGIYLHDTPRDELFDEASRLLSAGCVRLQDADRLARWLHGSRLQPQGKKAEQKVPLKSPVPVYLTYLTTVPSGNSLAYFDDLYGWDRARLAQR